MEIANETFWCIQNMNSLLITKLPGNLHIFKSTGKVKLAVTCF